VQVQDRRPHRLGVGVVVGLHHAVSLGAAPNPLDTTDRLGIQHNLSDTADDRREDDAADGVDDLLHGPELVDLQAHRVAEEGPHGLTRRRLPDVVEHTERA
jgi:hypothetical protein